MDEAQRPPPPWPSSRQAWYAVAILLLAYTVSFADRMIMSLLIGPIRAELNISDIQASLLIGLAFASFYAIMGLPFGALVDRVNRKWLIVIGICFWCVMTALCGVAGTFWLLFLMRMGVGVGEATLSPSAYSMLADYFPRDKLGKAISVYTLGVPIGSGLALMAGGLVVQAVANTPPIELPLFGEIASWRLVFFGVGLPGLLVAVLMATVKEPPRRGVGTLASRAGFSELWRFIGHARGAVGLHILGISLMSLALYGAIAWIPAFLTRVHGVAPGHTGLILGAIIGVAGVGGLMLGGWWADREIRRGRSDGHARTVFYAMLGFTPFLAAAPFAPGLTACLVLLTVGMTIAYAPFGVAGSALQLITPNRLRGKMTAIYLLCSGLAGLGLGPTVVAMTTDLVFGEDRAVGYAISVVTLAIMPLAALSVGLALKPFRKAMAEADA